MKIIARIRTDFTEKFGIPRQSGLVEGLAGRIVFEPEYRVREAFRGLSGYSHIWILWQFSEALRAEWSPTVLPPRLGGKERMGVFATRSPFRPNPIGLSCVKLQSIDWEDPDGPVLIVEGADLLDGTPIYDIKPYLAYTDSHPEAVGGFSDGVRDHALQVDFPADLLEELPEPLRRPVMGILAQDPRPAYHHDPNRRYGVSFGGYDIRFYVDGRQLSVCQVVRLKEETNGNEAL